LQSRADALKKQGKLAEAVLVYRQSQEEAVRARGKDHSDVGFILESKAEALQGLRDFEGAEAAWKEAVRILDRGQTLPDRVFASRMRLGLAELYRVQERHDDAESMLEPARNVLEPNRFTYPTLTTEALCKTAMVAAARGRWDEAESVIERTLRLRRLMQLRGVNKLTSDALEREGSATAFHLAFSVARRRCEVDREPARFAAWSLNTKALSRQALGEQRRRLWSLEDPATRDLGRLLTGVQSELASLAMTEVPRSFSPRQRMEFTQRMIELAALERRFADQLGRHTKEMRISPSQGWDTLDTLRAKLPDESVFIDILRYDDIEPDRPTDGERRNLSRMMAFVVPSKGWGEVRVIDLGPVAPIYRAVYDFRTALQMATAPGRGPASGREVEAFLCERLQVISERVLAPLGPEVEAAKHWIVSPDATLWQVPWCALPVGDGAYAVERHSLRFVSSGRELLSRPADGPTGPPVIVADPDYDLGRTQAERGQPALFAPLPGTAAEAEAIVPPLTRYAGAPPRILSGDKATESAFRAIRRPRVLVLSTHGFCDTLGTIRNNSDEPLLRCGLALAGANVRRPAIEASGLDGILSGMEVLQADLRGTDLVVLSACDTASGRIQLGQDVASLREAFQLAGAHSVLATLWPIPDRVTAQLMARLFESLVETRDKAQALRAAQIHMIQSLRDRSHAANPALWAAFVLTGRPEQAAALDEPESEAEKPGKTGEDTPMPLKGRVVSQDRLAGGVRVEVEEIDVPWPVTHLPSNASGSTPDGPVYEGYRRRTEWWKTGQRKAEVMTFDGLRHGISRRWYPNGAVELETRAFYDYTYAEKRWSESGVLLETYRPELEKRLPDGVRVYRHLWYDMTLERPLRYDLYLPEGAGPFPIVAWFHGPAGDEGDWATGTKDDCPVTDLTARGFAVASVEYRFSQEAIFPAQLLSAKHAIRHLHQLPGLGYTVDADRIGVCGFSAGGHIAALLGTTGDVAELEGRWKDEPADASSRVQAVCVLAAPIDFLHLDAPGIQLRHDDPRSAESRLVGGAIRTHVDRVARANPMTYLSQDDPPFLILHGAADRIVPVDQARSFAQALEREGVPVTLRLLDSVPHRLASDPKQVVTWISDFFESQFGGGSTRPAKPGDRAGAAITRRPGTDAVK
jgi:CHAT domain-containing protein/acetyl esterase/lipase/tetratricopeptide (TPR) repeat protein